MWTSLIRRTSFRIAALFAGLFSLTIVVIFTVLYVLISSDLVHDLKEHVDETRGALAAVSDGGGPAAMQQMISRQAAVAQSEEDIYLLTDAHGAYLAGNVSSMTYFNGWKTIPWSDLRLVGEWSAPVTSTAVVGRWTDLKDQRLFVADGDGDMRHAQEIVLDGLIWGLVMSAVSAFVGALLLGFSAQRRVGAMEVALGAVARGELGVRVPRSSTGDDLDHVAELMNDTLNRLQALISSLKQVSTDVAHDLKTPLGRVRQRLELLASRPASADAYRGAVNETIGDLDGIIETFEALLRIAEIEGGARRARFADIDLAAVLSTVHEALEPVSEDAGRQIALRIDRPEPAIVRGDRELLFQLFTNLAENAIRHCPQGSRIEIALRSEAEKLIATVTDDGPGIPADEREKVFERLYRLEKSRTTPGSGLGLSLAAAIAESHNAKIALGDNNPGLAVSVTFDRAAPSPAA